MSALVVSSCSSLWSLVTRTGVQGQRLAPLEKRVSVKLTEEVLCVTIQDAVDDGHANCSEKQDVLSQHREESKFKKSGHVHGDG